MCCNTVPQTDNSRENLIDCDENDITTILPERTKLTEEGGKPHTVIQVSRGVGWGEAATSWALF